MHVEWTDKLSDYLDDELSPGERAAVDAHLADCPECRHVRTELQRVVGSARGLMPLPPARDLWTGVADPADLWRYLPPDRGGIFPAQFRRGGYGEAAG